MNIKNKKIMTAGVFMLCVGLQFFNYGGSTANGPFLTELGGYHFYSLVNSLGSAGSMIALPAVGAICNKTGSRNIICIGTAIMLVARFAIQVTSNSFAFMVWQFMGSFGAGLIMSIPYSLFASMFEQHTAIRYYGFLATMNAMGALCGPVFAGMLVDAGYTKFAYLIWIPLILVSLILILWNCPNIKGNKEKKFDVVGLCYLATFVVSFILWLGLSGKVFPWISPGLLLLVIAIVTAVLLVRHSKHIDNPTVPLHVFRYKNFRTAFTVNFLLVPFATCSAGYVLMYILYTMGQSTTVGSTGAMPNTILTMVGGLFMGRILAKNFAFNVRKMMLISSVCFAGALLCFCLLQPESSMIQIWIGSALGGIANSIAQTCLTPFFQHNLPSNEVVAAQGMYQFSGTCGSAIFGSVAGVAITATGGDVKCAFYLAFLMALTNIFLVLKFVKVPQKCGT